MLWGYSYYTYFNSFRAGIDCRLQHILAEAIKSVSTLEGLTMLKCVASVYIIHDYVYCITEQLLRLLTLNFLVFFYFEK